MEKLSCLGKALFSLVTNAYFSQLSIYGSGFCDYELSFSSSITSIYKAFVLVQEVCSKLSKFLKAFFLDPGARVLNFKEAYLAHLLVFSSDSKYIILLKGLSPNHFKSFKEILCGRSLMMKKDYKSSR